MQAQRIEDQPSETQISPSDRQKTMLALLLEEPGPWSVDELVREFDGDELGVTDSLGELVGYRLVHRLGDYVFASYAARRAAALKLD